MKACNSAFAVTIQFKDSTLDPDEEDDDDLLEVTVVTEAVISLPDFVQQLRENFDVFLDEHGYGESDAEDAEIIKVEDVSADAHYSILQLAVPAPETPVAVSADPGKL